MIRLSRVLHVRQLPHGVSWTKSHLCCVCQEAVQYTIDDIDLQLGLCSQPVLLPHGILYKPQLCVYLLCSMPNINVPQTALTVCIEGRNCYCQNEAVYLDSGLGSGILLYSQQAGSGYSSLPSMSLAYHV